tara:strand:+ start:357 stop:1028 length:672 start_codon:yes stop_codon:yes gene_type:complete
MNKNLVAVIPVRKGSQRVKNKNFKFFAGKNLLIHKIQVLKQIKKIDEIIVNTDSNEAIQIAKKLNVNYHIRKKYFASSKCSNSEFWSHIGKVTNAKYIMFTNCTSPLIKKSTYEKIIKIFKRNKIHDSINTVTDLKDYLYLKNKPLNFKKEKAPNSQDLPDVVKLNFAVNIISKNHMFKKKTLIGNKPFLYKLDEVEGFDINTPLEFKFAEYLFKKKLNRLNL